MLLLMASDGFCFILLPHGGRYFLQTKASAKEPGGTGWSEIAKLNFDEFWQAKATAMPFTVLQHVLNAINYKQKKEIDSI